MDKPSYLDNRIEENFGGLKSDISILRYELKEEIEGVKSTLTGVEKSLESAWNVIAELQAESKSQADFKKTYQSSLDNVKSELAMASSKNAKLETEIDTLKVRFLEEREKVIALENYSRRENLRFMNVPEQVGKNCANIIYDINENELNMDVENLQFHAIHRVGKRPLSDETSKAYPRPIIIPFSVQRGQRYGRFLQIIRDVIYVMNIVIYHQVSVYHLCIHTFLAGQKHSLD